MIKIKKIILLVSLTLFLTDLSSWAMSPKKSIYKAYIGADMQLWRMVIDSLHTKSNKTIEQEIELLNYEYGYIGWCLSQKKKQVADIPEAIRSSALKAYNQPNTRSPLGIPLGILWVRNRTQQCQSSVPWSQ